MITVLSATYGFFTLNAWVRDIERLETSTVKSIVLLNKKFKEERKYRIIRQLSYYRRLQSRGIKLNPYQSELKVEVMTKFNGGL